MAVGFAGSAFRIDGDAKSAAIFSVRQRPDWYHDGWELQNLIYLEHPVCKSS